MKQDKWGGKKILSLILLMNTDKIGSGKSSQIFEDY